MKEFLSGEINELYDKAKYKSDGLLLGLLISGNIETFYSCLKNGYLPTNFVLYAMEQTGHDQEIEKALETATYYSACLKPCFNNLASRGKFDLLVEIVQKVRGGDASMTNERYSVLRDILDLFVQHKRIAEIERLGFDNLLMHLPEGLTALIKAEKWYTVADRLQQEYRLLGYESLEQAVDQLITQGYGKQLCCNSYNYEVNKLLLKKGFEQEFVKLKRWYLLSENGFPDLVDWDDYVAEAKQYSERNACFMHDYQKVLKQRKQFRRQKHLAAIKEKLTNCFKKSGE